MVYPTLTLTFPVPGVALVMLNRLEAANALNAQMAKELAACLHAMEAPCRVIVLTGAGTRAFCAGADLKERKGMDQAAWEAQHFLFRQARDAISDSPAPVIAAVNGAAFGGGLELALACDFIYAADLAHFSLPEATLGIMPGLGGTQTLPRAIGPGRALELMLTGRAFTAQEAQAWGMVNKVVPQHALLEAALAAAAAIAGAAPLAVRAIRQAARRGSHLPLKEALEVERDIYAQVIKSQDRMEGIDAFNEKRQPVFKGE